MPHQCTNCARVFDDGSKEMLSGCPDCGGNKFQFRPDDADGPAPTDEAPDPPEPPEPAGSSSVARTVGKTAATVRDLVGGSGSDEPSVGADGTAAADADPAAPSREDTAQASARTDVVAPDELPSAAGTETEHRFRPVQTDDAGDRAGDGESVAADVDRVETGTEADHPPDTDAESAQTDQAAGTAHPSGRPDLDELRAELNDQFESIKVLSPGQYELNLMELYDREEYIVALQEDGRYSIQVPENFRE